MKKILFVFAFLMLISTAALAEEAALPTFDVTLNGQKIESASREYPLLVYKDITYFPMTYYDCRFLGLTTDWDNDTSTLSIKKENISGMYRGYASEAKNKKQQTVEVCGFGIVVNGKAVKNSAEKYPLLTFRGVTYFPLTWRFAHDEFGWEYSYTDRNGLVINSDNYHTEVLDLPDAATDGTLAVGTDGKYYYYKGNENKIYRTPVYDIAKNELIHTIPKGGKEYVYVNFYVQNDELFVSYNNGYNARSANSYFKIVDGKMVETDEGDQVKALAGNQCQYDLGDGLVVRTTDLGTMPYVELSYTYNGVEHRVKKDGVFFGVYENDGKPERSECFYRLNVYLYSPDYHIESESLYLNGYDIKTGISSLYRVELETGKITKLLEDVGRFYAANDGHSGQVGVSVIFWRDGQLFELIDNTYIGNPFKGSLSMRMDSALPMKNAVGEMEYVVAFSDAGHDVTLVTLYSGSNNPGKVLFHTDSSAATFVNNGMIGVRVVEDLPGNYIHFAAVDPRYMPYFSADFADTCFYSDRVLLYTTEGKAVRVEI